MKRLLVIGLLGSASLLFGCGGNACEEAGERVADKLESCGISTRGSSAQQGSTQEEATCSEAQGAAAQRYADCFELSSCEDIETGAYRYKC